MKPARAKDIHRIYQQSCRSGSAFAFFRLPDTTQVYHVTGEASHKLQDGEPAFAFAPFDPSLKPFYIKEVARAREKTTTTILNKKKAKSTGKGQFTKLVTKIIKAIKEDNFQKMVAARVLAVDKPSSFEPLDFFEKLCRQYQNAFVSLTYVPGVGLWIGASPEVLVSETKNALTVYSLAGTRSIAEDDKWNAKELREQSIVTDFISRKLQSISPGEISKKGPVTHIAGNLKHLLTVFAVKTKGQYGWKAAAKALHPTPAVGGIPRGKALKFIFKEESFDRAFYAGYLGPVNRNGKTDLFVNIRCMEVREKQILLYAGCGVTADSDPEKEWLESERKIAVLKSMIWEIKNK